MRVIHSRSTDMKDLNTGRGFAVPARQPVQAQAVRRKRFINAATAISFQLATWLFCGLAFTCGLVLGFLASYLQGV